MSEGRDERNRNPELPVEQSRDREVEAGEGTAWHRWRSWVLRNPARAVGSVVGAVLLIFLVRWLIPDAVDTVTLERRDVVETLVTTGRVRSVSRAGVGAPLAGTVAQVEVDQGDRVAADQLLLRLEDAELGAAVEEARARLVGAEASLGRVMNVDLPSAAATLDAAELEAQHLRRDVERLRTIYEAGGLSRQDLEAAERAAEAAEARLASARTSAGSVTSGGAERLGAEAAVAQARESLDAALARLELTRVRTPTAGTVLVRNVEPGDAVMPGQVLMEIALDGPTELVVFPDERSVAGLRVGQAAIASADAFPDQRFAATVKSIAPVVDAQQGTIEVRLAVPTPPAYLLADMTVSVNIELDRRANAWTLPLNVLRAPLADTSWVLVVRGGRAERTPIDVGIRDERFIEVISGVEEDESVVAEEAGSVEPGARVRAHRRRDG